MIKQEAFDLLQPFYNNNVSEYALIEPFIGAHYDTREWIEHHQGICYLLSFLPLFFFFPFPPFVFSLLVVVLFSSFLLVSLCSPFFSFDFFPFPFPSLSFSLSFSFSESPTGLVGDGGLPPPSPVRGDFCGTDESVVGAGGGGREGGPLLVGELGGLEALRESPLLLLGDSTVVVLLVVVLLVVSALF